MYYFPMKVGGKKKLFIELGRISTPKLYFDMELVQHQI